MEKSESNFNLKIDELEFDSFHLEIESNQGLSRQIIREKFF